MELDNHNLTDEYNHQEEDKPESEEDLESDSDVDIDITSEDRPNYEENFWGQHSDSEGPDGYTFKSKKRDFENAVDSIEKRLKKGVIKVVQNNKIHVLDAIKKNGGEGKVSIT